MILDVEMPFPESIVDFSNMVNNFFIIIKTVVKIDRIESVLENSLRSYHFYTRITVSVPKFD